MKQIIINYILARLKEASTWRGIIMLVAGTWATQHPEQAEAIIPIALAIVGSIGAFMPDKSQRNVAQDSKDYQDSIKPSNKPTPPKEEPEEEPSSGWGDRT